MELLIAFLEILELIVLVTLGLQVAYFFIFSLASVFKYNPGFSDEYSHKTIGIIVPAYKEDRIILDTARNLSKLSYPKHLYKVVVAADQLMPETVIQLRSMVDVLEVSFEKNTL